MSWSWGRKQRNCFDWINKNKPKSAVQIGLYSSWNRVPFFSHSTHFCESVPTQFPGTGEDIPLCVSSSYNNDDSSNHLLMSYCGRGKQRLFWCNCDTATGELWLSTRSYSYTVRSIEVMNGEFHSKFSWYKKFKFTHNGSVLEGLQGLRANWQGPAFRTIYPGCPTSQAGVQPVSTSLCCEEPGAHAHPKPYLPPDSGAWKTGSSYEESSSEPSINDAPWCEITCFTLVLRLILVISPCPFNKYFCGLIMNT